MRDVAVVGVGMTRFGKYLDKSLKDLVREAVQAVMADCGAEIDDIEAAYCGNCVAGLMTGQEAIRGQVTLCPLGFEHIPIFNIESACATSSAAFHLAWQGVALGLYDCALVVGYEKLYDADKQKSFQALNAAVDVETGATFLQDFAARKGIKDVILDEGAGTKRSVYMDMYSYYVKPYMTRYGLTQEHFARLSSKNHNNSVHNPYAQYQHPATIAEVLASGDIVFPLTRMMCAPIGDGAAAAILCSKEKAARFGRAPVWVAASVVASGSLKAEEDGVAAFLAPKAFQTAGIGPADVDVMELHDAAAPSEIMSLIQMGFCPGEDAARWIEEGCLEIGGDLPCNPSGGLQSRGHPIGATGAAQIFEIVQQLRGEAGARQVKGAKTGMTHNGGGILGVDAASMVLHIFKT